MKVNVWQKIDDALLVSNGGYVATPKRHDLLVAREDHKRTVKALDDALALLGVNEQQVRELQQENDELRDMLGVAADFLQDYMDGIANRDAIAKWMKAMYESGCLNKETA